MLKDIIFLSTIILFINLNAQDKRYTHNSENGYMWQDFEKRMIARDMKYNFLSAMLDNQKLKNLSGNYKNDLDCIADLRTLQKSGNSNVDLDLIVKMVDRFYGEETNLRVPINYAYCYCIKELAGYNSDELNSYREKVLKFCEPDLKK
jgi:hypothetical protein